MRKYEVGQTLTWFSHFASLVKGVKDAFMGWGLSRESPGWV